jgi:hypothetical protein
MQAISTADNHRHFVQAFWTQVFHKTWCYYEILLFELDEESQDFCTIITSFGKYKYLTLPMGLECFPDIAQAVMENVL